MKYENLKSLDGSPRPLDIFQPHMPGVDLLSNIDTYFVEAREQLATNAPNVDKEQKSIAFITPGRHLLYLACPRLGSISSEATDSLRKVLPPEPPLKVSVVAYTFVEALTQDADKCIPFLEWLKLIGYIGHNILVFEGHPSAFAHGVRDCDVLILDSGMMPFIQNDWLDVAYEVMHSNPKVFIHNRETSICSQVQRDAPREPSRKKRWWQF